MAGPAEATTNSTAPSSSNAVNKAPTSSHRLPTVSASDAFRDLEDDDNNAPSNAKTNIPDLDNALGGGFECGKVTELWGPPGAGKTAIALSAVSTILQQGSAVAWIDTSHPLSTTRLPPSPSPSFHHTHTPTLSHLLALLLHHHHHHPTAFPPPRTRLLVLTNPHSLLETSNPRTPAASASEPHKWAAARRYALLGSLVAALNRLAASRGIAVVVTTGCATRAGPGAGPLGLVPGVGGREWEAGVWGRAVVGREMGAPGRWVVVEKVGGVAGGVLVGFEVGEGGVAGPAAVGRGEGDGVGEGREALAAAAVVASPVRGRKRAAEEIADSDEEEEEFGGWAEEVFDAVEGDGAEVPAGDDGAEEGGKTTIVLD